MIDKIANFNPVAFRGYSATSQKVSNPVDNQSRGFNSDFYVDKNGAEAIKAMNFVANPTEINKPISYKDYIKQLQVANLSENNDFITDQHDENGEKGFSVTIIRNGNAEKPYKTVFWFDGEEKENYGGYEDILYPMNQNQPVTYLRYDKEGLLEKTTKNYTKPDNYKDLFPENIDINTTPQEYTKILDNKNIKYEIDKNLTDDNATMTSIYELNDEERYIKKITFFEYPNGYKSIFYQDKPGRDGILTHEFNIFKDGDFYELYVSENEKYKGNAIKNTIKY